ncbi:MAG: hypothetical protein NUW37_18065 [Planctomycetes bacterium]|nr:hypothetical protein [Planctomycetota bacterium]
MNTLPRAAVSTMKDGEKLFGQIAVELGYVNSGQLEKCFDFQQSSRARKHIGAIMKILGFISDEEMHEILAIQKRSQFEEVAGAAKKRKERTFGYLSVKLGYMTEEQVYACVREQARCERLGLYLKLGEICINRAFLRLEQVEEILELQTRVIFDCHTCGAQYNIQNFKAGTKFTCQKCGAELTVP